MSLRVHGCYPPPQQKAIQPKSAFVLIAEQAMEMENLRIEVQAIKECQNEIKTQVDEIPELIGKANRTLHRTLQNKIDEKIAQIDEIKNSLVEYMTTSDFIRKNGIDIEASELGKFCAQHAKKNGGIKRTDGWFDNTGERLSHSFPSPDTRFSEINKWKISYLESVIKSIH